MNNSLNTVISIIGDTYQNMMTDSARHYCEVNIGKRAEENGIADIPEHLGRVNAIVLLKHPVSGMKVRIDGRTFVDYAQFDSGIVVPGFVARETKLSHKPYIPRDSMVLNCA
ncbi:MAG: hypothetical protein SWH61_01995 [Thermodesulfobacteriota bacterium]|nr:hypothetical protein [Thermodesulfobacteriota bacterium]